MIPHRSRIELAKLLSGACLCPLGPPLQDIAPHLPNPGNHLVFHLTERREPPLFSQSEQSIQLLSNLGYGS